MTVEATKMFWHIIFDFYSIYQSKRSIARRLKCRRKAARSPSSRSFPVVAPMTSCSLHPSHRRRKTSFVGRRPVKLILVRQLCACITVVAGTVEKKSETFKTSFKQASGSVNGMKKNLACGMYEVTLKFRNARCNSND